MCQRARKKNKERKGKTMDKESFILGMVTAFSECVAPFLTDSRIKSVGRVKGILTTQGFLFFCPGILTVMVCYGIIEKGGIICS